MLVLVIRFDLFFAMSQVIYQPIDYAVSSTELVFENPYSAAALSQTIFRRTFSGK